MSPALIEGWSLGERLSAAARQVLNESDSPGPALTAWRQAIAPQNLAHFEKRMAWAGLTLNDAVWALNPPLAAVPRNPGWQPVLQQLQAACRDAPAGTGFHWPPDRATAAPFEELFWPVCLWARQGLRDRLPAIALAAVAEAALDDLTADLRDRLSQLCAHALYDLFCAHRGIGATLMAGVASDGTAERYDYLAFIALHRANGLASLLQAYPVLGRLLATVVGNWWAACQEMLLRIAANRAELAAVFGIPTEATLSRVEPGLGDAHRGGRCVAGLHFGWPQGEGGHLVYKPRDMGVDGAFQAVLRALNRLAGDTLFRTVAVSVHQGFGFMGFVAYQPSDDDAALSRFYGNAGRLLAVLYMLGGDDCHHENLIAAGDQLILIDAETLLQSDLGGASAYRDGPTHAEDGLAQSVLRVGFLPQWRFSAVSGRLRALDVSALGVTPPTQPSTSQAGWLHINSDAMHWGQVEKASRMPTSYPARTPKNRPLAAYQGQIKAGFAEVMALFLRHKEDFLTAGGLLDGFKGLPRRVVVRPTYIYSVALQQACAPEALKSAVARGLVLEPLSRSYLVEDERPLTWPLLAAELQQLEAGDVPYFEQPVDSCDLPLPGGQGALPGFAKVSGLAAARARLASLTQADIQFQMQLIQGALEASLVDPEAPRSLGLSSGFASRATVPVLSQEQRLREALRLANQLKQRRFEDRMGRAAWLGLDLGEDQMRFQFGIVGPGLYSGRTGIALFLATLAQALSAAPVEPASVVDGFRDSANEVMAGVLDSIGVGEPPALARWVRDQPLGLAGVGGMLLGLLALHRLGLRSRRGSYLADAAAVALVLTSQRVQADRALDMLSGCAGLIGPLLRLAELAPAAGLDSGQALGLVIACGDRLCARQDAHGGWPRPDGGRPLTGFSHGSAGVAVGLDRLHRATGQDRFMRSAARALGYERALFSSARGNWPDFRATDQADRFMNSWCHGAPGIALSRLCLLGGALDDAACRHELEQALTTAAGDDETVDQLCCGNVGKAAILGIAARQGLGAPWQACAEALLARTVAHAQAQHGGYRLFDVKEAELFLPGLFVGLSGIGLGLLACSDTSVLDDCLSGACLGPTA